MNIPHPLPALCAAVLLLLSPGLTLAGEGHDHGAAPAASASPALPRFTAVSDAFELVGILQDRQLTLYLDRATDNSPVTDADIELDIAGTPLKAEKNGDGTFVAVLPTRPEPGLLPITATLAVGGEADLLAGELDLHEAPHADAPARTPQWKAYAGWGLAALALLAALAAMARRMGGAALRRTGGAA